jgi:hypothetical protein
MKRLHSAGRTGWKHWSERMKHLCSKDEAHRLQDEALRLHEALRLQDEALRLHDEALIGSKDESLRLQRIIIIVSLVFITFIGGAEGHDNHPHEEVGHCQGGDEVVRGRVQASLLQ